eukprot:753571-Hanusia_phi.AAC.2
MIYRPTASWLFLRAYKQRGPHIPDLHALHALLLSFSDREYTVGLKGALHVVCQHTASDHHCSKKQSQIAPLLRQDSIHWRKRQEQDDNRAMIESITSPQYGPPAPSPASPVSSAIRISRRRPPSTGNDSSKFRRHTDNPGQSLPVRGRSVAGGAVPRHVGPPGRRSEETLRGPQRGPGTPSRVGLFRQLSETVLSSSPESPIKFPPTRITCPSSENKRQYLLQSGRGAWPASVTARPPGRRATGAGGFKFSGCSLDSLTPDGCHTGGT